MLARTGRAELRVKPISFRGQAALLLGQLEGAAEVFAHDALMGGNPAAVEGMKEAYASFNGGAEGFDDYALATRQRIARSLPEVTLADYTGEPVSLSAMAGKVMMISVWNPG